VATALPLNASSVAPGIGSHAPDVELPGLENLARGEPRVLAFVREAAFERDTAAAPEAVLAIRAELRGLGAELVVLSRAGVWWVRPDDAVERVDSEGDAIAASVTAAAARYGVAEGDEAVFVIDGRGIVRFAHRPAPRTRPLCSALADALAIAGQALYVRAEHDARQRLLFTRREWSVTCLVVGCAAAFLAGCKEQPRAPEHRPEAPVEEPLAHVDVNICRCGAYPNIVAAIQAARRART
jgi:hypothetical protein